MKENYERLAQHILILTAIDKARADKKITHEQATILEMMLQGEGWEAIRQEVGYTRIDTVQRSYYNAAAQLKPYLE